MVGRADKVTTGLTETGKSSELAINCLSRPVGRDLHPKELAPPQEKVVRLTNLNTAVSRPELSNDEKPPAAQSGGFLVYRGSLSAAGQPTYLFGPVWLRTEDRFGGVARLPGMERTSLAWIVQAQFDFLAEGLRCSTRARGHSEFPGRSAFIRSVVQS